MGIMFSYMLLKIKLVLNGWTKINVRESEEKLYLH